MDIVNNFLTDIFLTADTPVTSDIDENGDADLLRVALDFGITYGFTATTPGSDVNPYLSLLNPFLSRIATAGNSASETTRLSHTANMTGEYFLRIRDYSNDDTGPYTLSMNADDTISRYFGNALEVAAGSVLSSAIDVISDQDLIKTTLTKGLTYGFEVTTEGSDVNPYLSLFNQMESRIATNGNSGSDSARINYTAAQDGDAYLRVQDYSDNDTGSYRLRLIDSDRIGNTLDTAVTYVPDAMPESGINVRSDVDMLRIHLTEGLSYGFQVSTPDSDVNPYLQLYNLFGSRLATSGNSGSDTAWLYVTAAISDSYYLSIQDYSNDDSGAYLIELLDADTIVSDTTTQTRMGIGDVLDSAIDVLQDEDMVRVALTKGLTYGFTAQADDGSGLNPYMQMYNVFGSRLLTAGSSDGDRASFTHTAAASTDYFLSLRDYSSNDIGGYQLAFNGEDTIQSSFATQLYLDGETPLGSAIDVNGDIDMVRIAAQKGMDYAVSVTTPGSDLNPYLTLHTPVEQRAATAGSSGGTSATIRFDAAVDGDYFASVGDYSNNDAGSYQLTLNADDTISRTLETQTDLTPGGVLASRIDTRSDVDMVRSGLTEGITYGFRLSNEGSSVNPYLELFNALGSRLQVNGFSAGNVASINFTAAADADYFLSVRDYSQDDVGDYSLQIINTDTIKNWISTDLVMRSGQILKSAINVNSDQDMVALDLVAGVTYSYCLSTRDADLDLMLELFGPDLGSERRVFGDNDAPAMIEFTATETGRHYLRVSDSGNDDTGIYNLIAFRDLGDGVMGTDAGEELHGGGGFDTIIAGAGADTVGGGDDADTIDAGPGNDVVSGDGGADSILGGTGGDTISGGFGADTIKGGAGNDLLRGDEGNDSLFGGDNVDRLFGGDGADTLLGGNANDQLYGGTGADSMEGGWGNDRLFGGAENDTLAGGGGNDRLTGGTGADDFLFDRAVIGADIVTAFESVAAVGLGANDRIVFTSAFTEITDFAGFVAASQQVGANVVYDLADDGVNRIQINGVQLIDLTSDDIVFV